MNRRQVMAYLGATAAGLTGFTGAHAADEGHMQHFLDCADECAECSVKCDSCFHHCAGLVAGGNKEHVKSMNSCVDCAAFCRLSASLCGRGSSYAVAACEACAKVCDDCASHCEKFANDKHMAECAKACRDCAKECREMIKHVTK